MSLYTGPGWINPKEKDDMSTKPIAGYRLKDGKLVKVAPRMAVSQKIKQRKSKKVKPVRRTP